MSSERLPLVLWLQCQTGCDIHIVLQTTENMYISNLKTLEDLNRGSDMLRQMNKTVSFRRARIALLRVAAVLYLYIL